MPRGWSRGRAGHAPHPPRAAGVRMPGAHRTARQCPVARLELGAHVLDDAGDRGGDLGVGLVVGRVGAVPGVVHAQLAGGDGIGVEGAEQAQLGAVGVGAGDALEPLVVHVVDGQHEVVAGRTSSARSGGRRGRPSRCPRGRCGAARRPCAGACRCRARRSWCPRSRRRRGRRARRRRTPRAAGTRPSATGRCSPSTRRSPGTARLIHGGHPRSTRSRCIANHVRVERRRGTSAPRESGRPPRGCGPTAGRR